MYNLLVQFNIETATKIFVLVTSTTLKGLERGEGRSNKITLRRRKKVGPNIKTYYLPRSSPWRKYNPKNGDPARLVACMAWGRGVYVFVFCRFYPSPPLRQCLSHISNISLLLTNIVSPVRACLSI